MALRFSIYYHTQENGALLKQLVDSSGMGHSLTTEDLNHCRRQPERH